MPIPSHAGCNLTSRDFLEVGAHRLTINSVTVGDFPEVGLHGLCAPHRGGSYGLPSNSVTVLLAEVSGLKMVQDGFAYPDAVFSDTPSIN